MNQDEQIQILTSVNCSTKMNQAACLLVIGNNSGQACYWDSKTGCKAIDVTVLKTAACEAVNINNVTVQVSPSVCALIDSTNITSRLFYSRSSCFYKDSSKSCSQLCLQSNLPKESCLKLSQCEFVNNACRFKSNINTCEINGINEFYCFNNPSYCKITRSNITYPQSDGTSKVIEQFKSCTSLNEDELRYLKCTDGLNIQACLDLSTRYQTCVWDPVLVKCRSISISSQVQCKLPFPNLKEYDNYLVRQFFQANENTCRMITYEPCSYDETTKTCTKQLYQSAFCNAPGLNRLGCLSTKQQVPCYWDSSRAQCFEKNIKNSDKCEDQKDVNRNVCSQITNNGQKCMFDQNSLGCKVVTDADLTTLSCSAPGLNRNSCIAFTLKSCRWASGQCSEFTEAQGSKISCVSLSDATAPACRYILSNDQPCIFETGKARCTTSIKYDTLECNTDGMNAFACQRSSKNCYWKDDKCVKVDTDALYKQINCSEYPSQTTCKAITKPGQYCQWDAVTVSCVDVTYLNSMKCTDITSSNGYNVNACLGFTVDASVPLKADNYCIYDTSCKSTSASLTDCGSDKQVNVHACVRYSSTSKTCYFDRTQDKCTELTDTTLYTSLLCVQGNKLACPKIKTTNQRCVWNVADSRCYSMTTPKSSQACADFSDTAKFLYGSNICAAVSKTNEYCRWSSADEKCVTATDTNYACSERGLNAYACMRKTGTTLSCFFDTNTNQCTEMTVTTNLYQISCSQFPNKNGCMKIQGSTCVWTYTDDAQIQSGTCSKQDVSNTSKCSDFSSTNGKKEIYNSLICASIQLAGQFCSYDSTNYKCITTRNLFNCATGFNKANCPTENCEWNTEKSACTINPKINEKHECGKKTQENECLNVQTMGCVWLNNQCFMVSTPNDSTCTDYQVTNAKYSKVTCQLIQNSSAYCKYDQPGSKCVEQTTADAKCDDAGLNMSACLFKTNEACYYKDNKCQKVNQHTECHDKMSQLGCTSVSKSASHCQYKVADKVCSSISSSSLTQKCSDYTAATGYQYNPVVCAQTTDVACYQKDSVCSTSLPATRVNCDSASKNGYNKLACLSNTYEACYWDEINRTCASMKSEVLSTMNCSAAQSLGQCINITTPGQYCSWDSTTSTCTSTTALPSTTCDNSFSKLLSINVCMSITLDVACYFEAKSDGGVCSTTKGQQICAGMNRKACIASGNACVYTDNRCQQMTSVNQLIYQVKCSDYVSEKGCLSIQHKSETCEWKNGACSTVSTSGKTCTDFTSSKYSPSVCSSISSTSVYCGYDDASNACIVLTAPLDPINDPPIYCTQTGLNVGACTQITNLQDCLFDTTLNRCIERKNTATTVTCASYVNQLACLKITSEFCNWDSAQKKCVSLNLTVSSTDTCESLVGKPAAACMAVTNNGQLCSFDYKNQKCVVPTDTNLDCFGLNVYACQKSTLINASAFCKFENKECKSLEAKDFPSLNCTDQLSRFACIHASSKCCKWNQTTNVCENATVSATDECLSLNIHSQKCCQDITKAGESCQFKNSVCVRYQNVQPELCQSGINRRACLGISQTYCQWKDDVCQNYNQEDIKNLKCASASINMLTCAKITTEACYWDTVTWSCKIVPTIDATTSCTSLRYIADSTLCSKITKAADACLYDSKTMSCIKPTNSVHTCNHVGINKWGCLYLSIKCYWDDVNSKCEEYKNSLVNVPCKTLISREVCRQLPSTITDSGAEKKQECFFNTLTGQCEAKTAATLRCSQVTYTNAPRLCRLSTDVACKYNPGTHSCIVFSGQQTDACEDNSFDNIDYFKSYNLNRIACLQVKAYDPVDENKKVRQCIFINNQCSDDYETYANTTDDCTQYKMFDDCMNQGSYACKWTAYGCLNYRAPQTECLKISSYVSKRVCLLYASDACDHDDVKNKCKSTTNTPINCSDARSSYQCTTVANKTCYFDQITLECKTLDETKAAKLTCADLQYSTSTVPAGKFCVLASDPCTTSQGLEGNCRGVDLDTALCTDYINKSACLMIRTPGQYCIWSGSKCQATTLNSVQCTQDVNINSCLQTTNTGQNCIWLGQKCDVFSVTPVDRIITQDDTLLVSSSVCAQTYKVKNEEEEKSYEKQFGFINIKWDPASMSCRKSDLANDTCSTPGLNQFGCRLSLPNICNFDTECKSAESSNTNPTQCSTSQLVSAQYCSQVKNSSILLMCKYNAETHNCVNADIEKDSCSTAGINEDACRNIKTEPCFFKNNKCQSYKVIDEITFCLADDNNLPKNSNAVMCQRIRNGSMTCKYDSTNYECLNADITNIETCTTIGLNREACVQVKRFGEACQYYDDQCVSITQIKSLTCQLLSDVNETACRLAEGSQQPCKYSEVQRKCIKASPRDNCFTKGLNKYGCKNISGCKWYDDFALCTCDISQNVRYSKVKTDITCNELDVTNCNMQNTICFYDTKRSQCRRKTCNDIIDVSTCKVSIVNGETCYWTLNKQCNGSFSCSELYNVDLSSYTNGCNDFKIDGTQCTLNNGNNCQNMSCDHVKNQTDCEKSKFGDETCYWNSTDQMCYATYCELLKENECNRQLTANTYCQWYSGKCFSIYKCTNLNDSVMIQYWLGEGNSIPDADKETICKSTILKSKSCAWLPSSAAPNTYECTDKFCSLYGASSETCQGKEIYGRVCQLVNNMCVSCEEITNPCLCKQQRSCSYINGVCRSQTCSQITSQQQCDDDSLHCRWNQKAKICQRECSRLTQTECASRTDDCYWDTSIMICLTGAEPTLVINPLSTIVATVQGLIVIPMLLLLVTIWI